MDLSQRYLRLVCWMHFHHHGRNVLGVALPCAMLASDATSSSQQETEKGTTRNYAYIQTIGHKTGRARYWSQEIDQGVHLR